MNAYQKRLYCFFIIFNFAVLQNIIQISCAPSGRELGSQELGSDEDDYYIGDSAEEANADLRILPGYERKYWEKEMEINSEQMRFLNALNNVRSDPNSSGAIMARELSKEFVSRYGVVIIGAAFLCMIIFGGLLSVISTAGLRYVKPIRKAAVYENGKAPETVEAPETFKASYKKVKETSNRS